MSLPVFHLTPICSPFWRDVHDEALMELLDCHFRKGSRACLLCAVVRTPARNPLGTRGPCSYVRSGPICVAEEGRFCRGLDMEFIGGCNLSKGAISWPAVSHKRPDNFGSRTICAEMRCTSCPFL